MILTSPLRISNLLPLTHLLQICLNILSLAQMKIKFERGFTRGNACIFYLFIYLFLVQIKVAGCSRYPTCDWVLAEFATVYVLIAACRSPSMLETKSGTSLLQEVANIYSQCPSFNISPACQPTKAGPAISRWDKYKNVGIK